jgi:hypothetical protein
MRPPIAFVVLLAYIFTASCTPVQSSSVSTNIAKTPANVASPTGFAVNMPTPLCEDALSVIPTVNDFSDIEVVEVNHGEVFLKTWKIQNLGSCLWQGNYGIIYSYGERMKGQPQPLTGSVAPGEETEVSVQFTAPKEAGEYLSAWQMVNSNGITFGKALHVRVVVN